MGGPPAQSTSDGKAASDVSSRSDGPKGNGSCGGDNDDGDDPPAERSSKKRSAHEMDVVNEDDDDEEEDEEGEDDRGVQKKKKPPTGLLKVSQALQGLGYIYEKDLNARHAETPSVRAGAVYWK